MDFHVSFQLRRTLEPAFHEGGNQKYNLENTTQNLSVTFRSQREGQHNIRMIRFTLIPIPCGLVSSPLVPKVKSPPLHSRVCRTAELAVVLIRSR